MTVSLGADFISHLDLPESTKLALGPADTAALGEWIVENLQSVMASLSLAGAVSLLEREHQGDFCRDIYAVVTRHQP